MSRRNKPEEEMPPAYANIIDTMNAPQIKKKEEIVVPDLVLFGHELKGLKDKISDIKLNNLQSNFCEKVKTVLDLFDKENNQYSDSILYFVMSCVENQVLKKGSGELKKRIVIECTREYFDNNDLMISKMIDLLMPSLNQNKFIKRNGKKVIRFFSEKLKMKSPA
jgi:hypothetical protein